jgi:hypothetical protein
MRSLCVYVVIVVLLYSCSRHESGTADTELPVIALSTPPDGGVLTAGTPLNITGTITDNGTIAEVHIHVTDVNTGTKYLDVHLYPGTSTTSFSNHDLVTIAATTYKIQVIAIDRGINEARATIQVSCN